MLSRTRKLAYYIKILKIYMFREIVRLLLKLLILLMLICFQNIYFACTSIIELLKFNLYIRIYAYVTSNLSDVYAEKIKTVNIHASMFFSRLKIFQQDVIFAKFKRFRIIIRIAYHQTETSFVEVATVVISKVDL